MSDQQECFPRRIKYVDVSLYLLVNVVRDWRNGSYSIKAHGVPEDVKLVGCVLLPDRPDTVRLWLESETFEPVSWYDCPPELNVIFEQKLLATVSD